MGKNIIDLSGKTFGRLKVIKEGDAYISPKGYRKRTWLCKCSCGNDKIIKVQQSSLTNGSTLSCGCLGRENRLNSLLKHNMKHTRLYNVWQNIKRRCYTKTNPSYKYYGGKNIKVCDEWRKDFKTFYDWSMANGYNEKLEKGKCTIDRINVNGNYEPSNCRWVTMREQMLNKNNNIVFTYNGKKMNLIELCEKFNKKYDAVYYLYRKNNRDIEKTIDDLLKEYGIGEE